MIKYVQIVLAALIVAGIASLPSVAQAAQVELRWQRPKASSKFVGYRVYSGPKSGDYNSNSR